MFRLIHRCAVFCMLLFSADGLLAEKYCSLEVTVESEYTDPVSVTVVEADGWKSQRDTEAGVARFCGLGIRSVSVVVGKAGCNQVFVRDVPLRWMKTTALRVVHQRSICLEESPPVAACTFLLRFANHERKPISGVALEVQAPFPEVRAADEHGRILFWIAAGKTVTGVADHDGYLPQSVSIECVGANAWLERLVILQRSKE